MNSTKSKITNSYARAKSLRSFFAAAASILTMGYYSAAQAQSATASAAPQPGGIEPSGSAKRVVVVKLGQGDDSFARFLAPASDGGGYTGSAFVHVGVSNSDGSGVVAGVDGILNTPQQYATASYSHKDPVPYSGTEIASFGYVSGPGPTAFGAGGFGGVSGNNGLGALQDGYHSLFGIKQPNWNANPGPFEFVGGINGWGSKEWIGTSTPIGGHVAIISDVQGAAGLNVAVSRVDPFDIAITRDGANRLPVEGGQVGTLPDPLALGEGLKFGPEFQCNPIDPAYVGGKYGSEIHPTTFRYGLGVSLQLDLGIFIFTGSFDSMSAAYEDQDKPKPRGDLKSFIDNKGTVSLGMKF